MTERGLQEGKGRLEQSPSGGRRRPEGTDPGRPRTTGSDRVELVGSARALLGCLLPWIEEVSVRDWKEASGFAPVLRRSVLRRQFEALEVTVDLVESERGFAAVPLVRPACEEVLWLRYLEQLTVEDAKVLTEC